MMCCNVSSCYFLFLRFGYRGARNRNSSESICTGNFHFRENFGDTTSIYTNSSVEIITQYPTRYPCFCQWVTGKYPAPNQCKIWSRLYPLLTNHRLLHSGTKPWFLLRPAQRFRIPGFILLIKATPPLILWYLFMRVEIRNLTNLTRWHYENLSTTFSVPYDIKESRPLVYRHHIF